MELNDVTINRLNTGASTRGSDPNTGPSIRGSDPNTGPSILRSDPSTATSIRGSDPMENLFEKLKRILKGAKNPNEEISDYGSVGSFLPIFLLFFQILMIVIFAIKGEYGNELKPIIPVDEIQNSTGRQWGEIVQVYPMFQDVHVMIFIGFGFLMTFLKKYGYGAISFNMFLAALVIQWAIIVRGALNSNFKTISVDINTMLDADFASAAILISFGALLGKTSPTQLTFLAIIEIVLWAINAQIGVKYFQAADIGGSIFLHVFGAYFGLAAAAVMHRGANHNNPKEGSVYHSDLFSMIGTVFLWMFWPSFNSAAAIEDGQHRAVANTYLSMCTSCIVAFAMSAFVNKRRFNMVHIQNATLAGGVAVGAVADMVLQPWGAMTIGGLAGMLSVIGFRYITPFLSSHKLHDTCGVNNLHGMPGLMAGIASIIVAFMANKQEYGDSLGKLFVARLEILGHPARSSQQQAAMQAAALVTTLAISIAGGAITGFILRFSCCNKLDRSEIMDDSNFWDMPDEGVPLCPGQVPDEYQVHAAPQRAGANVSFDPSIGPAY